MVNYMEEERKEAFGYFYRNCAKIRIVDVLQVGILILS